MKLTSKTTTRSQTKGRRVPTPFELALAANPRKRAPASPSGSPARSKSPSTNAELKKSQDPPPNEGFTPPADGKAPPSTPVRRPSEKKKKDTAKNKTPAAIREIKAAKETTTQAGSGTQDAEVPGSSEPTSPLRAKALDKGFLAMTDQSATDPSFQVDLGTKSKSKRGRNKGRARGGKAHLRSLREKKDLNVKGGETLYGLTLRRMSS